MRKIYLILCLIVSLTFSVSAQQMLVGGSDYPGVNGTYTLTSSGTNFSKYEKVGDPSYYFTGNDWGGGSWNWEFYITNWDPDFSFYYGFSSGSDPTTVSWSGGFDFYTETPHSTPVISLILTTASVTTATAGSITYFGATLGGEVTNIGGSSVSSRGIEWGLSADNLNNTILIGSGIGSFEEAITGLNSGTIYYYRAFAVNSYGTVYGDVQNFNTLHDGFDILVVSGGGSGGAGYGGGGGGGAVKYFIAPPVSGTTAVTVGAGGAAVQITTFRIPVVGNPGESSSFGSLVATSSSSANGANDSGGGGGGAGSGGGAGGSFNTASGGTAVSGMGYNGGRAQGNGINFSNVCGGGGGGAGAIGADGLYGTGGTGGVGISNSISGAAVYYGGGGGGGITYNGDFAGSGGNGGGGAGSKDNVTATSGTANTGGGGGGFGGVNGGESVNFSGAGGSGIVIIRYLGSTIRATGGTITQVGGYTIHTFYSSGTFSLLCGNLNSGGAIADAQSGSNPFNPAAFTSSSAASGQSGTLEYKWQSSTTNNSSGFSDIVSSNAATYDAGALTQTTWFRRLARVSCSADWSGAVESNVLEVTVSSTSLWTGASSSAWNDAGNWSTNSLPTTTSEVTIAVAANQPLLATDVAIKSLTINSGATLTVPTGLNLTVSSYINNSGTMTVENNANLIQEGTTNSNIGAITVKRNSNALKRLDYTVWSSPVASQQLLAFSPATVANRFFTYNTATNLYNVVPSPATTNFALGNGYLIRMPNTASDGVAIAYPGEFIGVPNNGSIPVTLANNGVGMRYNAVGNPYPSPISITQFVSDNSANITSSLYFWRKTNAAGGSAYCTLNNGTFITNNQAQVFDPNGIIQTGQGFFVEAKDLATSLTFNNGQRVSNTAGQFFKTKQVVENNRIWLNVTNNQGEFGQMAINYTAGATNDVDEFDAKYFNDGKTALNSVLNTIDYVIQGRALPFDATDEVTLSFKAITAGTYSIAIDRVDGLFVTAQDIILKDTSTGAETNLKAGPYYFAAEAGAFSSRFVLKYQKTLKVDAPAFNENTVSIFKNNGAIVVNSTVKNIKTIEVYDVRGRLIAKQKNVNATSGRVNNVSEVRQVLIVKVSADDNNAVTKKVLN